MNKILKKWLWIALSLICVGTIIFLGALIGLKGDLSNLSASNFETNRYEITKEYKNISVVTNTADVRLMASEDGKTWVECYEQENAKHTVTVKDNTLTVEIVDKRKWYEFIGITWSTPKITVCIPQGEYEALSIASDTGDMEISKSILFKSIDLTDDTGDITNYATATESVKIKTATGDIRIENASAGAMELSVSTGKIYVVSVSCAGNASVKVSTGKAYLTNLTCKNLVSNGTTGDIFLTNVIVSEKISVERSTGDIKFDGCDGAEIFAETSTGDVTGTLLSERSSMPRRIQGE